MQSTVLCDMICKILDYENAEIMDSLGDSDSIYDAKEEWLTVHGKRHSNGQSPVVFPHTRNESSCCVHRC